MALEIFRLVGSVFVDTDKADKSLKKTDKNAEGLGHKLLNAGKAAGKFALGVGAAAGAAGAALVAVAENTREYRTEQGKLQTAFADANFSAAEAQKTYRDLNGILGDGGQAVEAANHLAKLCDTQEQLSTWTDICTGVYGTFGASLPIEGLTEAANETAKTGALTGSLADALNWAGVNEDQFQESLDACNSEREREALITETLNGLYSDAAEKYREVNGEVINANMAQDRLNASMAMIGGAVEPLISSGKILLAEVFERMTPAIEWVGTTAIPWMITGISQLSEWIGSLIGRLSDSGITFGSVLSAVQMLWVNTCNILKNIWDVVGKPLWDAVMMIVGVVGNYFAQRMPMIQEAVRTAFTDIKVMWENHLRPALQAVGDFIKNVLAPAFKFVFETVIAPVVDTAFRTIKQLWNNTLKPVFTGILDFIQGVFTLNFKQAFQGLVTAVGGIWNGLKTVVKAPINAVISIINSFTSSLSRIKIPDWVPAIGGAGINIPQIPYLEDGGILEKGQIGFLEGNGAEAVVPLHNNQKWVHAVAEDMDRELGGSDSRVLQVLLEILDIVSEIAGMEIRLDTDALVGGLAKPMDKKLGQIQARKARA